MALDLDAFATWRAIAKAPALFAPMAADAARATRKLLVKCLKAKALDLAGIRAMRQALGAETFGLILDGMTDAEVKTLVARFDRHNREAKSADGAWRRRHFVDLVQGAAKPVAKAPPAKSAKGAGRTKTRPEPPAPRYVSAGAVRKRTVGGST
jgi:hypothetical protein